MTSSHARYRVGLIGAGKLGTALASLALNAGHEVRLSGSPRQTMLPLIIDTVLPGAELMTEAEVIALSDVVILALPFGKAHTVDLAALSGRVVIDAMNAWEAAGGHLDDEHRGTTSSLLLQRNPDMRLVKSLNHLGYLDLTGDAREPGHPLRRAIAVISDDAEARATVASLVDSFGFDPVEAPTSASRHVEPDSAVFGHPVSAAELREALLS